MPKFNIAMWVLRKSQIEADDIQAAGKTLHKEAFSVNGIPCYVHPEGSAVPHYPVTPVPMGKPKNVPPRDPQPPKATRMLVPEVSEELPNPERKFA